MKIQEPSPLGAETRALIEAARGGHEPNELGRARVRRGVEVKLAAGVGLALGPASSALAGAAKITLVVATVTTVVGAGIYALPHRAPRPEPIHATAPIARRAPAAAPAERPAPVVAPAPLAPRRHAHVAAAPVDNTSALAQETALLGAANTALAHRDVASALALLDDYDHRVGPGILVEERAVTGVLAFCAAGRVDAARAEARRFRARWPRSPLAARVDGSCVAQVRPPASAP